MFRASRQTHLCLDLGEARGNGQQGSRARSTHLADASCGGHIPRDCCRDLERSSNSCLQAVVEFSTQLSL